MSNWIKHVKDYASKHNIRYKDALSNPQCKASYHKQYMGNGASPYQMMSAIIAKGKFDINRVRGNIISPYLINKYGNQRRPPGIEPMIDDNNEPNNQPNNEPLFRDDERLDFNVGRPRTRARTGQREADYDREREQRLEREREKQTRITYLQTIQSQIKGYTEKVGRNQTIYEREYKEVEKKRIKFDKKQDALNKLTDDNRKFRKETEKDYPELFKFIRDNKIKRNITRDGESFNQVYIATRNLINQTQRS